MSILQSIILGIIQGLTEFFPVSSSGHLGVLPFFFNWTYTPLYFTVIVHFATLLSVVTVFYREIFRIIKGVILGILLRSYRKSGYFKLGIFIIIASMPAALAGFLLEEYVEKLFEKPLYIALFLALTALVLWTGEIRGRAVEKSIENKIKNNPGKRPVKNTGNLAGNNLKSKKLRGELIGDIEIAGQNNTGGNRGFTYFRAIIVGIGQALAIFPGISRSGTTISFARFFGIKRSDAVKFSFLLSIPVILGSFIFELYNSYDIIFSSSAFNIETVDSTGSGVIGILWTILPGFVFAYLTGMFAIKFMVRISSNKNLNAFAVYCLVLSFTIVIFYIFRNLV